MISWHTVQTASLRASLSESYPPTPLRVRNSLARMRESLHLHWTAIVAYLQRCHDFSEDVIVWEKSLGDGHPDPGSVSWLDELTSFSDEISLESKDLVRQSDKVIECLSSLTPQLSELLQGSSRPMHATGKFQCFPSRVVLEFNPTVFPATSAFLGIHSSDGFAAITSTSSSLAEIRASLCIQQQFWAAASEACRSLQKSNGAITQDRARRLGETWKELQVSGSRGSTYFCCWTACHGQRRLSVYLADCPVF